MIGWPLLSIVLVVMLHPLSWWCCLFPSDLAPLIRGRKNLPSVGNLRHEKKLCDPPSPQWNQTCCAWPVARAQTLSSRLPPLLLFISTVVGVVACHCRRNGPRNLMKIFQSLTIIFISASFVPSLFGWNRKVYSGRREADLVMSSVKSNRDSIPPESNGFSPS